MKNNFAEMSFEELVIKRDELRTEMHDIRIKKTMGQLSNPLEIRSKRRQMARVLTRIYNYEENKTGK